MQWLRCSGLWVSSFYGLWSHELWVTGGSWGGSGGGMGYIVGRGGMDCCRPWVVGCGMWVLRGHVVMGPVYMVVLW